MGRKIGATVLTVKIRRRNRPGGCQGCRLPNRKQAAILRREDGDYQNGGDGGKTLIPRGAEPGEGPRRLRRGQPRLESGVVARRNADARHRAQQVSEPGALIGKGLTGGAGGDVAGGFKGQRRRLLRLINKALDVSTIAHNTGSQLRSEERRVGKECRSRWWTG